MLHAPRFSIEMGFVNASHLLQRARRPVFFSHCYSFIIVSQRQGVWAGHVTSRDR